ncbi:MAG: BspA family leucine-rich repeat surface protein, partial [Clostridia bacterium]|nr:BspA family leucine-rich repeat surface protein [Clostridia bacterium]
TATQDSNGNTVTNDDGFVVYNAGQAQRTEFVDIGDVAISPQSPSVEFYFTVHNLRVDDSFIQVIFGKDYTATNMTLKTYYANTDTFSSSQTASSIPASQWKTNAHVANAVSGGCKMIKVVVSVDNANVDASISGDFSLTLNYSDTAENLVELDYDTLIGIRDLVQSEQLSGVVFDYTYNQPDYAAAGEDAFGDGSVLLYLDEQGIVYFLSNSTISLPSSCEAGFVGYPSLVLNNIETSNVTNMMGMFGYYSGESLDLSLFDTASVTSMSSMFGGCIYLTSLDLSNFDTTNVTDMAGMFDTCASLTSLDVSNFDTSNVTDMNSMFFDCGGLTNLDLSNFKTSNVTNMANMFGFSETHLSNNLISLDLSGFDTSNVTDMSQMFWGRNSLTTLNLSSFNTSSVTDMSEMFAICISLKTIYVGSDWTTSSVTSGDYMFSSCIKLRGAVAYDSTKIDHTMANYTTGYLTYKSN